MKGSCEQLGKTGYRVIRFFLNLIWTGLVLGMTLSSMQVKAAAANQVGMCSELFHKVDPRYYFGQVTFNSHLTADEFFESAATAQGKPRLVMMVGAPGAGKSKWTSAADRYEWTVLSIDPIRIEILSELKAQGELVTLGHGKRELADPSNPEHHFAAAIIEAGKSKILERFHAALSDGRSIVIDQNNILPNRIIYSEAARAKGYSVEALLFDSPSADANIANVKARSTQAGAVTPTAETIKRRFHQLRFYNSQMRIDDQQIRGSTIQSALTSELTVERLVQITDEFPTVEDALRSLSQDEAQALKRMLDADRFHRVETVFTPDISKIPHDSPLMRENARIYAALTNKCNRACPWCCVYSNPYKNTFLTPEQLTPHFPADQNFDLQLEGGEPTIHPRLFDFVANFRKHPRARGLVLVTNGVKLPREIEALKRYLVRFGAPLTIKLSVNHYLLERDKGLMSLAQLLNQIAKEPSSGLKVILNVRLRKGVQYGNDSWVLEGVRKAGLEGIANVFFLQRYGLAATEQDWEAPFTVTSNFILINPDGSAHTGTLEDRANRMGELE